MELLTCIGDLCGSIALLIAIIDIQKLQRKVKELEDKTTKEN